MGQLREGGCRTKIEASVSQLKESLKNLLTKMKEEDVTLDDEELGSMTDLCNTDEMRGS